jgi:hypothetical protein
VRTTTPIQSPPTTAVAPPECRFKACHLPVVFETHLDDGSMTCRLCQ